MSPREQGEAVVLLAQMAAALWQRQQAGTLEANEWELLARTERFLRLEYTTPDPAAAE